MTCAAANLPCTFLQSVPDYYGDSAAEREDFQAFTDDQEAAAREILSQISEFTNITFIEATDEVGDLTFGTADLPTGSAWAYGPSTATMAGDIWLDNNVPENSDLSDGGDGFKTMLHEVGHALGLAHPEESGLLAAEEETRQYSVMSYSEHSQTGGIEPSTFMTFDIAALQHLYGSNETETSGNDVYDLSNLNDTVMTISDSGGWDVFDASASKDDVVLDLNAGSYSSSGTAYGWFPVAENIGLAYGSEIEEAIGGSGDDTLIGNELDNHLTGGEGADTFVLGEHWGNDQIKDFEDGTDVLDLTPTGLTFEDLFITDADGGVVVSYDENSVYLDGAQSDEIDHSDFYFI